MYAITHFSIIFISLYNNNRIVIKDSAKKNLDYENMPNSVKRVYWDAHKFDCKILKYKVFLIYGDIIFFFTKKKLEIGAHV